MPNFLFLAGTDFVINNLSSSGLGFYSTSFGGSVAVGSYNQTTWITDSNGTIQGPQCDNIRWRHPSSGSINEAAPVSLISIPNYLATLNIRFNHTSAIKTQNAVVRIFDRSNINNNPSGVTTRVAEIIHTDTVQNANGSGDATWLTPMGSSVTVSLVASPGHSGHSPNGAGTQDANHDWYVAISPSPDSIGSKTQFGLYVETEYL